MTVYILYSWESPARYIFLRQPFLPYQTRAFVMLFKGHFNLDHLTSSKSLLWPSKMDWTGWFWREFRKCMLFPRNDLFQLSSGQKRYMELNNISKKGMGTSKYVFYCLICKIISNNNTSDNVLQVTTKRAIMDACAETVAKTSACLHLKMNHQ
jgi:hypothetical protein